MIQSHQTNFDSKSLMTQKQKVKLKTELKGFIHIELSLMIYHEKIKQTCS